MDRRKKNTPLTPEQLHKLKLQERKNQNELDLYQFCMDVAETIGLPEDEVPQILIALKRKDRPSVIYLHNAECTGCSGAMLRSSAPYIDQLIFDAISLDYHETLMASAGDAAEEVLETAINNPNGFICLIEGAIPSGDKQNFGSISGHSMYDKCKDILPRAKAIVAVGTCSAYGGIQTAYPNPTDSKGIEDAFDDLPTRVINVAGCPPNPLNIMGTIVALLIGKEIKLDKHGRPTMFYGQTVHMNCERLPHFKAKNFALSFNSEEARKGYCLFKLGCKGPKTFNNCPTALFNEVSWPIKAGHPCIGCSEPHFWDRLTPFYPKK